MFVIFRAFESVVTLEFVVERPKFTFESATERLDSCPFVTVRELLRLVTFALVYVHSDPPPRCGLLSSLHPFAISASAFA